MEGLPIIPWYLDTDFRPKQKGPVTLTETSTAADLAQPWRVYWPPRSKHVLNMWSRSEYPEVISWRFDSAKPFDRPWRIWTKSLQAMKEQCAVVPCKQDSNREEAVDLVVSLTQTIFPWCQPVNIEPDPCISLERHVPQALSSFEHGSQLDLIDGLNLPYVVPETFHYLATQSKDPSRKLYMSRLPYLAELKRTNITSQSYRVKIQDVSGHEEVFKLDDSGFQFVRSPIRVQHWSDASVCADYLPRMADWLQIHLNCDRVFIYAYNFRGPILDSSKKKSSKAPFLRVHCDATAVSCLKRLQLYSPSTNPLKTRVRLLNIWRPLSTPIQSSPLAFCDYRTTKPQDFVPADIIFPHYHDEAYEILHNPAHRWFYKKGMDWDDVLLFKLGDSMPSVAPLCPHSAFIDPSIPPGCPQRMSIEVRAIAIG